MSQHKAGLYLHLLKLQLPLGVTVPTAPQRVDQRLKILLSSPLCSSQSANIPARFHVEPHPLLHKSADSSNLAVMSIKALRRFQFASPLFESGRDSNML